LLPRLWLCHLPDRISLFEAGKTEVLAACGVGDQTPGSDPDAFTTLLSEGFKTLSEHRQPRLGKTQVIHEKMAPDGKLMDRGAQLYHIGNFDSGIGN
jgi:hypothetical protein